MLGKRLNKDIGGCHILCLGWLRTKCSREVHHGLYIGGSRGGQEVRTPLKNHKKIGFLAIWVRIPENDKATKQAFNVESSSAR